MIMEAESKYLGAHAYLIAVAGDLDFQTADSFVGELEHVVGHGARAIIADLTSVGFIDSTGLSALLRGAERLQPRRGELVLVTSDPMTLNLLEVTGLDRRFPIFGTLTEAIARGSRDAEATQPV
jgi:anti-sigma B factor antagonist